MATEIVKDAKVWIAGYDVSGRMNQVQLEIGADLHDVTVLGDAGRRRIGGLTTQRLGLGGFWEGGADKIDEILFTRVASADVPIIVAKGPTEGDVAYLLRALVASYSPGAAVGDPFGISAEAESSDGAPILRGTLVHNATKTVTGAGTAFNLGAVTSAQKLYAVLHVVAASGGTPTLDVLVQSDDASGFASPTTRITFGQKTAIGAEWATPVAGAITDTWWRVSYTIAGTTPSFTFAVALAIK